jgi:hypothetical protein
MLDNINTLKNSYQTLEFYATKACLNIRDTNQITVDSCLREIKTTRPRIKHHITRQAHAKEQHQHYLASDIIDRRHRHLSPEHSLSDKLEQEDLIEKKRNHMYGSSARSNLFTMLNFDIEGLIGMTVLNGMHYQELMSQWMVVLFLSLPK